MSLITPRKTFHQSGLLDLNVEDFSSVGVYLSGTVTLNNLRVGASIPSGNLLFGAEQTKPTSGVPTIIDVKGVEVLQLNISTGVTGNNGILVVGQINKVTNF